MKQSRQTTLLNFNCTFGSENKDMLHYFESFLYPAFKSGLPRKIDKDNSFRFKEVQIIEPVPNRFALAGVIIRETTLENKTQLSPDYEEIKNVDEYYKVFPLSFFMIYLDNHRMVITKNQKGSPDYRSFAATAREVLKQYRSEYNKTVTKAKEKLPYATIDVIPIPNKNSISQKMQHVKKVTNLDLKLIHPNSDISYSDTVNQLLGWMGDLDTKVTHVNMPNPKNLKQVAELVAETSETTYTKLDVVYKNNSKGTITNNAMSEKFPVDLTAEYDFENNMNEIIEQTDERDTLTTVTEAHQHLYNDYKNRIHQLFEEEN